MRRKSVPDLSGRGRAQSKYIGCRQRPRASVGWAAIENPNLSGERPPPPWIYLAHNLSHQIYWAQGVYPDWTAPNAYRHFPYGAPGTGVEPRGQYRPVRRRRAARPGCAPLEGGGLIPGGFPGVCHERRARRSQGSTGLGDAPAEPRSIQGGYSAPASCVYTSWIGRRRHATSVRRRYMATRDARPQARPNWQ